jgi:glycosyltransferase involved in cell wall biosynthesis
MGTNREISISFITGQLGIGGSEKQLYLLARELILRGWRVNVIHLNAGAGDNWVQPLQELGANVISFPLRKSQVNRIIEISTILIKEKPLIVHSWSLYTNFYAALCGFLARTPIRLGSERGNQRYSIEQYGKWKYSLSLVGLQGLITNSEIEAQMLSKTRPGLRIEVIPNGVVDDGLVSREKARKSLGLPIESTVIAGLGSLTRNKNYEYLIEVFAPICLQRSDVKLVLIGDGPEKDRLLEKASKFIPCDQFLFTGLVADAYRLLKGIDILCVSSLTEGLPNVILEAFSAGIPVVATNVGAIPSIVKDCVNGFVVNVDDQVGFSNAVEKLIDNVELRSEMGFAGKELIQEKFGLERMANHFISFYQELADFTCKS